jgi:hypothetical protein
MEFIFYFRSGSLFLLTERGLIGVRFLTVTVPYFQCLTLATPYKLCLVISSIARVRPQIDCMFAKSFGAFVNGIFIPFRQPIKILVQHEN